MLCSLCLTDPCSSCTGTKILINFAVKKNNNSQLRSQDQQKRVYLNMLCLCILEIAIYPNATNIKLCWYIKCEC